MYTGSFTYWVRSVLSRHTVDTILGRLGYMTTLESEFSLVQAISKEDIKQMVFEIFLARVSCEAVLRTTGTRVLELGTEKLARPHSRHNSEKRLVKPCSCLEGVQPGPGSGGPQQGPSEGVGSERALAEGTADQRSLPMALSPSEVSTAPNSLPNSSPVPWGPQCHASTCLDSEEVLPCFSDPVLHWMPWFPKDIFLRSLKGNQLPGLALAPGPSSGHHRGSPRPGVEEDGQLGPLMGPESTGDDGSPESGVTPLWRSTQAPLHG
ncbi:hypothetical protein H8957_006262 [Semnopithecus entellus]